MTDPSVSVENDGAECYLCGGMSFMKRKGEVRDAPSIGILECEECGLVFLDDSDRQAVDYKNSEMHGGEEYPIDVWVEETKTDDERRFQSMKNVLAEKRILDFGCGHGGFLMRAKAIAHEVYGVELEHRLSGHFKKNGLRVVAALEELPQGALFDCITAFHVIEHLEDPRKVLKGLAPYLSEGGRAWVEVPSSLDTLLSLYESEAYSKFTYWSCHLYLFSPDNIHRLAEGTGLKVVSVEGIQRYPLSNHLHWLSKGEPGGHQAWAFLDSPELHKAYEENLRKIKKTDTIMLELEKL